MKNEILSKTVRQNMRYLFLAVCMTITFTGCGRLPDQQEETQTPDLISEDRTGMEASDNTEAASPSRKEDVSDQESAADAQIDFQALRQENPDIFAWLYIPGTEIDYPVLQSEEADDFYEDHNASGQEDASGAVYIELANLTSMCDFNTVLHGRTGADESGLFADLYRFADPVFFEEHEEIYLYLDGNVLTYEVFAAYERENTSLIRTYDFTYLSGCEQFLDDLYHARDMGRNLREGWEDVTPYHFLITLTTQKEEDDDRQFVVVAALMQDAAGTIDRVVME